MERDMKATNFLLAANLQPAIGHGKAARSPGFFERIDRWFWRQTMREREAYLAGAQDIFELEERIRRLERSVGSRYY
jgi:hypothetical protein